LSGWPSASGSHLLPEATRRASAGLDPRPVLIRALQITGIIALPVLVVFAGVPKLVLSVAFGDDYTNAASALVVLGAAMTVLAVSYLTVQYLIALGRTGFVWVLGVVAIAEPLLLSGAEHSHADVLADRAGGAGRGDDRPRRAGPASRPAGRGMTGAPPPATQCGRPRWPAPVALAFASGGFYDEARLVALIVVAVLLGLWALGGPGPLPRDRRVLLALGGMAAYCAWVALSAGWAPRTDVARHEPRARPAVPRRADARRDALAAAGRRALCRARHRARRPDRRRSTASPAGCCPASCTWGPVRSRARACSSR